MLKEIMEKLLDGQDIILETKIVDGNFMTTSELKLNNNGNFIHSYWIGGLANSIYEEEIITDFFALRLLMELISSSEE